MVKTVIIRLNDEMFIKLQNKKFDKALKLKKSLSWEEYILTLAGLDK